MWSPELARLVWFSSGDRAPGASSGIPLRCAELAVTGSGADAHLADQARLMSFTYTVWKSSMLLRASVRYGSPVAGTSGRSGSPRSPLGWLSTSARDASRPADRYGPAAWGQCCEP